MKRFDFKNASGQTLSGRLEETAGEPNGYALFAHCFTCSKNTKAATQISQTLASRGIVVLRFDFTGLGNSEGDFANTNFSSNVSDLIAAAAAMREHLEAPGLLVGHSLGGAAVLMAAPQLEEVRAVATIGAPSEPSHVASLFDSGIDEIDSTGSATVSIAGRSFRIERQFLDDLRTTKLLDALPQLRRALMIFHSPVDEIVSIDHASDLYGAARHPKSFVSLDGADHLLTNPADGRFAAATLTAWACRYLQRDDTVGSGTSTESGMVSVQEMSPDGFKQQVTAGRHRWIADEPVSVGGADAGPNPYDLLLAALGTCTTMTVRMYARRKKIPLQNVSVTLRHSRVHARDCEECESESGFIDRIDETLTLTGDLDPAIRERLLEISQRCPVHRTLMNEKQIVTKLAD